MLGVSPCGLNRNGGFPVTHCPYLRNNNRPPILEVVASVSTFGGDRKGRSTGQIKTYYVDRVNNSRRPYDRSIVLLIT